MLFSAIFRQVIWNNNLVEDCWEQHWTLTSKYSSFLHLKLYFQHFFGEHSIWRKFITTEDVLLLLLSLLLLLLLSSSYVSAYFCQVYLPFTSGWMDTQVFAEWFQIFTDKVKEHTLLLLFNGHLTHISTPVTREALDQQIVILKFPPHVTDALQPLDVTCFSPLKESGRISCTSNVNTFGAKHQ